MQKHHNYILFMDLHVYQLWYPTLIIWQSPHGQNFGIKVFIEPRHVWTVVLCFLKRDRQTDRDRKEEEEEDKNIYIFIQTTNSLSFSVNSLLIADSLFQCQFPWGTVYHKRISRGVATDNSVGNEGLIICWINSLIKRKQQHITNIIKNVLSNTWTNKTRTEHITKIYVYTGGNLTMGWLYFKQGSPSFTF